MVQKPTLGLKISALGMLMALLTALLTFLKHLHEMKLSLP
jgi:hypothetical protein